MLTSFLRLFLLLSLLVAPVLAQTDNSMSYATPSKSKFVNMPNLPTCVMVALERGDPSKGPSVLLLKFKPGCTIPWHWHTAGESLIIVSGSGMMQMKDGQAMPARQGDYVYLPGKNVHTFSSTSAVLLYDMPDGPFDIHYVNSAGSEIPLSDAVKSVIRIKPAAGPTTTQ
jgi:quercetin dioxygenase-like cupin family protein